MAAFPLNNALTIAAEIAFAILQEWAIRTRPTGLRLQCDQLKSASANTRALRADDGRTALSISLKQPAISPGGDRS